tara:strand:- start:1908 stop:2585 length:678 start_codon:yes stop_codon:yes gene_type:complete
LDVSGAITGALTGNASTATALANSRTISLSGDATGSVAFDGTSDQDIVVTVVDDKHNHTQGNVDGLTSALASKLDKSGGIMTGDIEVSDTTYVARKSPVFVGTSTKQNKINFHCAQASENGGGGTTSNDPGYIIHETSNHSSDTNKGVLHLCPTDDNTNGGNDYVAIHGTNDSDTMIKLHTGGDASFAGTITAAAISTTGSFTAGANINVNDKELQNVRAIQMKD